MYTVFAIKLSESGVTVAEFYRKMGASEVTFYNWKKKYGGLGVSDFRKLGQLEEESCQLKKLVADLSLDKQMLQAGKEYRMAEQTKGALALAGGYLRDKF
ncbi:hypothetical protein GCM10023188_31280 [Pontibacter saemangeumensis]|uniref:Transposase n=1 Tax=Pontibacter saemangeumensis TaxID=1084525 RepID=A0ABP8LWF4_9BACT